MTESPQHPLSDRTMKAHKLVVPLCPSSRVFFSSFTLHFAGPHPLWPLLDGDASKATLLLLYR